MASKCGEHPDFQSGDHMNLDILHVYTLHKIPLRDVPRVVAQERIRKTSSIRYCIICI